MPAVILSLADLYSKVPANIVNGYFDDARSGGVVDPNGTKVQDVLMAAEGEFYSHMIRAYPYGLDGQKLRDLADADPVMKMHLVWVALEFAAERRPEFLSSDGKGPYQHQYERAVAYFSNVSKGLLRSKGEAAAGLGANTGGNYNPGTVDGEANFVFAPSKTSPFGHGGY